MNKSTTTKRVGPVTISCMSPEYRDCLENVMNEWKKHKRKLPKTINGRRYQPGIYGFAYWLIRWSGLVRPAK